MKRNFFIGVVCAAVSCVLIYQTELVCWLLALVFLALCAWCFSRAEREDAVPSASEERRVKSEEYVNAA